MNKAAIASLLTLAAFVPASGALSNAGALFAQTPVASTGQITMEPAELADYNNAMGQATPAAMAPALEAYLAKYPKSGVKNAVLQRIMLAYSQVDPAKAIVAADNFLQVDPTNLQAYLIEVAYRKQAAEALLKTDPAGMQAGLDSAATFAQKGIAVAKGPCPADMAAADCKKLVAYALPNFYAAIGEDALNKNDAPTAIEAYKNELAAVPADQLATPAVLQEAFYLAQAYYKSTPPDYIDCTFYATRAAALAPDQFKPSLQPLADYCYRKYHGAKDGYDPIVAYAKSHPMPDKDFAGMITPAPTDAEIIHGIIASTPDLQTLALSDKEFILQAGKPEDAAKVWDVVKGKSVQIPGALVIAVTPGDGAGIPKQVTVAVSDDAVQSKKADFTFTLKPLDAPEEPKAKTPVTLAAYKKAKKTYDEEVEAINAAVAVGQKVTLSGTYDSYTPSPIMLTMTDGEVILPKAEKPKPAAPKAPAAHRAAH